MLKEEFNSSLLPFWNFNFGEHFGKPSSVECCFAHSGSCEHGFVTRLVLLDPTQGFYALSALSIVLSGYLCYLASFGICPFCCQVGPFHFMVFFVSNFVFCSSMLGG